MHKVLAFISGAALAAGVGAAQGGELYGGAASMNAAALQDATGMFASAEAGSVAANINGTGQDNLQGVGILGLGECIVCDASNSNETGQGAAANASASADNINASLDNVNVGIFAGSQF
jgi:hypothetical protein